MILVGLGAAGLGACSNKPKDDAAKADGGIRLGVWVPEVKPKPSAIDPLIDLAKPIDQASAVPRASKDGKLVPTQVAPSEPLLSLHAVTSYDEVWVYAEPNFRSEKLGFFRRGVRFKVTREQGQEGCRKGWFQLASGGFACASKGLIVSDKKPFLEDEFREASREPERVIWARVASPKTPMWWRLPSKQEWDAAQVLRRDWGHKVQPLAPGQAPSLPAKEEKSNVLLSAQGPQGDLPLSPSMPWLEPGFFVSLYKSVDHLGGRFWKTAQGAFIQENSLNEYHPLDFHGQTIDADTPLSKVAFVGKHATDSNERGANGQWSRGKTLAVNTPVRVHEVAIFDSKSWSRISPTQWVRSDALVSPTPANLPGGVEPSQRWIDIDLSRQVLVAYEGKRAVFATLIASGRPGGDESDFATPNGVWRIYSKEKSSNMVDSSSLQGPSFHQDVPWVMYFSGNLALRGSFWHRDFGRSRTAGSIDLGPSDARWLFEWSRPTLPSNWHGILQSRFNPGTAVSIRGQAPSGKIPVR